MGLGLAYGLSRDIIGQERAECLDVAVAVESLRAEWRPERVRVVLLAESHVFTSPDELQSRVMQADGQETTFATFVHCLGYGEPHLVEPAVSSNGGTWQYWRLFHDTLYGPATPNNLLLVGGEETGKNAPGTS